MNDFSEIENELQKLRPAQPTAELFERVEHAFVDLVAEEKIVRPERFRFNWLSLGIGLAAAALILIALFIDFQKASPRSNKVAAISPAPETRSTMTNPGFMPAGATQVVYHMRDEGLHFAAGSEQPVRRLRSRTQETWQWRNPATGASLQVSYPSEQVELIPVSGQ